MSLPIESVISELLAGIQNCSQLILKAQPGAGKSTYFPLELLKRNVVGGNNTIDDKNTINGKIVMLEPRRLAAKNIACYLAQQLGENVGEQVGYRIKGDTRAGKNTRLEVVTEGIMTRMLQSNPELPGVGLLIFDEFHERNLHADTSLAFALEVQEAFREDLKIVVMSATLDDQALRSLLPDAQFIESQGRNFPITYHYRPLGVNEHLIPSMAKVIRSVINSETGSLLAFLPSVAAIRQLAAELVDVGSDIAVYPLYGRLSFTEQQQAIAPCPAGRRKIVLATNIAETSLTIEGIRIVVDSGLEKVAKFDVKTASTRLEECRIAQSSAIQRAGRAGRNEAGICIRLYSEQQLKQQASVPEPEILHSDLSGLCLELAQWGETRPETFRWLDKPPQAAINQGFDLLQKLGLLSDNQQLTSFGVTAQSLGIDARLAAMLLTIKQQQPNLLATALALVPLVEENLHQELNIARSLYAFKQNKLRGQKNALHRAGYLAQKLNVHFTLQHISEEEAGLCLAFAFPDRIACKRAGQDGQFILSNGHGGVMDKMEPLSESDYIVISDLVKTHQQSSRIFTAAELNIEQLQNVHPLLFNELELVEWDDIKGCLVAEKRLKLGSLIISRQSLPKPNNQKMTQALLHHVKRQGLAALNWNEASLTLLERMRCGSEWLPEKSWPDMSEQGLLEALDIWLAPYMTGISNVKGMKKIDLYQALMAYIGWPLNQEIDKLLPVYYTLPTGQKQKITYKAGSEPRLSVRMQAMFGEKTSPLIADGRKKIVLELLSPAQRPLQITTDLARFWAGSYKEVQKEMKGRYPKHPWPDNPAEYKVITKTKWQLTK